MKNKTCCFTGHRNIPQNGFPNIKKHLKNEIKNLINQGIKFFGSGGALGFDTLSAITVLELKKEFPHIKLILALPCKNQTKGWKEFDRAVYNLILDTADKILYISEYYQSGCMHKRNRHLVDNSGYCICYLTHNSGGTFYTTNYAKEKNVKIINIADLVNEEPS